MYFNYKREKRLFEMEWNQQKILMEQAGMSKEVINELYQQDWKIFKENRNFHLHRESFLDVHEVSKPPRDELGGFFNLMESITDEKLYSVLIGLTDYEKTILYYRYEMDLKMDEIAKLTGKNYGAIKCAHGRLIKKIKKLLN